MRKFIMLVLVLSLLVMASVSFAAISGSRHDLINGTDANTAAASATLCGFCHIPHGGTVLVDAAGSVTAPLWARNYTKSDYTVYSSGAAANTTLAGTAVNQPGINSLTCLSCHDGLLGLGVTYKNGVQATNFAMGGLGVDGTDNSLDWTYFNTNKAANNGYNPVIGGNATAFSGNDLRDDHPVGIQFIDNAIIPGLTTAALVRSGTALRLYNYVGRDASVECGSCHDPHDTTNGSFIRVAKADLCQACHLNK